MPRKHIKLQELVKKWIAVVEMKNEKDLMVEIGTKKNSDKLRKYSRERNKLSQKEESFRLQKSCDQKIKNQDTEKFKIIDLKSDSQDCKDLNLSDFDIVSDTEENLGKSEEIIEPENYQMKNRHRNETNNQKVKLRNGDESSGSYLSNPDEISDFVLTPTPTKTVSAIYHDKLLCKNEEAGFPNLNPKESDQDVNKHDNIVKKIYGPALPPSVESLKCNALKNIPPNLSSHLKNSVIHDDNDKADNTFGPHLPQHFRKSEKITDDNDLQDATSAETTEDDDDGFVGPLPTDHPRLKDDFVQQQLQYRAQLLKKQLAEIDDEELPKREEWMTELPTIKGVNFGLEARKFRMRAGPDLTDRSDWTDSPADRAKKKSATSKMAGNTEYFQEIRRPLANKKKEKSLLDIHRKKIHAERKKKEKDRKKSGKREDRRPFNRDIDLQVNRLSEAHKSSMLLKAAQLDDRFLQGKI
uniref:K1704_1 protein n=1 Tax=Fopius arisanus TaxID=64838 RepID=A0A0C9R9S4_9HYME